MFWTKRVDIEIKTHCEFVPKDGWSGVPVCRDLMKNNSNRR